MQDLEQCIRKYGDDLYRFCCCQTKNRHEAEELYQDTFLCILEHQKKFQKVENKKCYILGIALNLEKNKRRKRSRRNRIAPLISGSYPSAESDGTDILAAVPADDETENTAVQHEILQKLRQEIEALSEPYRTILSLYYGNELSIKETAGILKIPPGTVKNRLYQARQQLKERLEGEGYDGTEIG